MSETALQVAKSVAQRPPVCPSTEIRAGVETDKAGEGTTDPAGPGGFQTWDMDQDFKQGIFCLPRGDGMGAVIVVQASGRALGPHWFRCCSGTVRLLQGSRWDLRAS